MASELQYFAPVIDDSCDFFFSQRVAERIRSLIMEGKLSSETQLPNELELSILL